MADCKCDKIVGKWISLCCGSGCWEDDTGGGGGGGGGGGNGIQLYCRTIDFNQEIVTFNIVEETGDSSAYLEIKGVQEGFDLTVSPLSQGEFDAEKVVEAGGSMLYVLHDYDASYTDPILAIVKFNLNDTPWDNLVETTNSLTISSRFASFKVDFEFLPVQSFPGGDRFSIEVRVYDSSGNEVDRDSMEGFDTYEGFEFKFTAGTSYDWVGRKEVINTPVATNPSKVLGNYFIAGYKTPDTGGQYYSILDAWEEIDSSSENDLSPTNLEFKSNLTFPSDLILYPRVRPLGEYDEVRELYYGMTYERVLISCGKVFDEYEVPV